MKAVFALLLTAALSVTGVRTSAQATITENQSTYLYVDSQLGSDSNSGAYGSPFKTVQAGVNRANALNQQGTGAKLIVNPGVYRESVVVGANNSTGATFTLQAAVAGKAIIAGSDVLTGWSQTGPIYGRGWPYAFQSCSIPSGWPTAFAPIALRTEMIFVNGAPLTQVLSYNDLRPGTFYINFNYAHLLIYPPPAPICLRRS